jgi:hypothetical protein
LRAFLTLRLSGGLRRRGYLLLARHLGFSPVSRRGLSGRWHDVLLKFRAVMALFTIGGVLARIKARMPRNRWTLGENPSNPGGLRGSWYSPFRVATKSAASGACAAGVFATRNGVKWPGRRWREATPEGVDTVETKAAVTRASASHLPMRA